MSKVRQSPSRRRVVFALALITSAIAGCDARSTAPTQVRRAPVTPAAIEGDTLSCKRGWVIITGQYVCNEDL